METTKEIVTNGGTFEHLVRMVEGIRQNAHAKVLVVGHRGDNFPEPYRGHAQLVFWEADEADARPIPASVRMVLVTRFLGHHVYRTLADTCAKRNIVFGVKTMGTGEVKRLLLPFVAKARVPEPEDEPTKGETMADETTTAKKFRQGELKAFVLDHGWDPAVKPRVAEAKRIHALATAAGYRTTVDSVAQTMAQLDYAHRDRERTKAVLERSIADAAPRQVRRPRKPKAEPARAKRVPQLSEDDAELMKMLDEALAAMGLVREFLLKRATKQRQIRDLLNQL